MMDSLQDVIYNTIRKYRTERSFFGGADLSERDQANLVTRLTAAIGDKLEDIDQNYVQQLEEEIETLKQELQMAKGPGYAEMRQELEGARALAKHLMYRLGKEDDTIRIAESDLQEMEQRVDLRVREQDGVAVVQVEEFEEG